MIKFFNRLTIATRLLISFSVIIVLFIILTLYSQWTMRAADRLYQHHLDYVVARREYVLSLNQQFTYCRLRLWRSLRVEAWRDTATYEEWRYYEEAITRAYANMILLADAYIDSALADSLISEEGRQERVDAMSHIRDLVLRTQSIFTDNFFLDSNRSFDPEDVDWVRDEIVLHLDILLQATEEFTGELMAEIESTLAFNQTLTIIASIAILFLAAALAFLMIRNFTGRIKAIETTALKIKQGDFYDHHYNGDEISNIIAGLVDIFTGLIREIGIVTEENEKGNPLARINAERFEGGYRDTALEINKLLDQIKEIENERLLAAIAEENSRAKSRFLARMSHEIRTPLTAILGIAEIQLQIPGHPMTVEEAFAKIHSSSTILLDIVNDILDLSKIEAGKMSIVEEHYELASLIIDVVQLHLVFLGSKSVEFKIDVDETLPAYLLGDELRMKQILNNLLSNAFKYTEEGTVDLIIRREPHSSPDCITLMLAIRDTGIGMDREQVDTLISGEYVRFNEKEHRAVSGSGLGIPIVINLLQLMGADIMFTSTPGEGTLVEVRIPQRVGGSELLGPEVVNNFRHSEIMSRTVVQKMKFIPEPMPYGRVVVVDDIDTNLYVIKGLLAFYELQVDTCISGREIIDKIKSGEVYDIIFMDHMMPELNGLETTQIIREMGYTHPIVALTANALVGQAEMFMNNGFDGFISKPVQTSYLNGTLNRFIRDKQPREAIDKARESRKARAKTEGRGINIDTYMEHELERLRIDFAKKEKNVAAEIKSALQEDNFELAQRLAHTLKGLAGFIREDDLSVCAAELEMKFGRKETADLSELEEKLANVLAQIVIPPDESTHKITNEDLKDIFNQLAPLLADGDTRCDELLPDLEKRPETLVLARQVSDYEFEAALVTLKVLRTVLNI